MVVPDVFHGAPDEHVAADILPDPGLGGAQDSRRERRQRVGDQHLAAAGTHRQTNVERGEQRPVPLHTIGMSRSSSRIASGRIAALRT